MDLTKGKIANERSPRIWLRSLVIGIAAAALAGCGDSGSDAHQNSPLSLHPYASSTTPTSGADQELPLQHYMLTGAAYDTVQRAVVILAQQCMRAQGFQVSLPPPVPASGPLLDISILRYTVVETLADAKEYGYRIPPRNRPQVDPAGAAFDRSLSPAARVALVGSSPAEAGALYRNGCTGVADKRLMGGAHAIVVDGLAATPLVRDVNDDPRAVESASEHRGLQRFASCMADAGYPDVVDPRDIPQQFDAADPEAKEVTAAERNAAVTQFECQRRSGVVAAMRLAETAFQLRAIDANPEAFAQTRNEIAAVVRRATTIIGTS